MRVHLVKYRQALLQGVAPFVIYSGVMAMVPPRDLAIIPRMGFFLYALFIFVVVWQQYQNYSESKSQEISSRRFFSLLLIGAGIFLVATRLYLFIRYGGAPLGYDTGFYIRLLDEADAATKLTAQISNLLWTPLLWLGIPKLILLHALYVLAQFLVAGSLYTLARTLTPATQLAYAAPVVFLFSVSLIQFSAFWWMFYQTHMAVAFLLMTIALIQRRSYLAILTAGFGAASHTPTFFPFAAAFSLMGFFQFARSRIRKTPLEWEARLFLILAVLTPFALILLRGKGYLLQQLRYISRYKFLVTNFLPHQIPEASGLFINFAVFQPANIYLYPFAILGILLFLFRGLGQGRPLRSRLTLLFVFGVVLFLLAYFPFIYRHRFLIYLDLVLIIFAVYPFLVLILYFLQERAGYFLAVLLIVGFVNYASITVARQRPQLFSNEMEEMKSVAHTAEPFAYAMATDPLYTPWVYGFMGRRTIAPGYLENRWRFDQWDEFWLGRDNVRRHELLRMYRGPIYIFVGERIDEGRADKQFIKRDAYLTKISPHVWKYDTRGITLEEIANTIQ